MLDAPLLPGHYKVVFEPSGLTSGLYLYQIRIGDYTAAKKMALIR